MVEGMIISHFTAALRPSLRDTTRSGLIDTPKLNQHCKAKFRCQLVYVCRWTCKCDELGRGTRLVAEKETS